MDESELGPDFESGLDGHVVEMFDMIWYERKRRGSIASVDSVDKDAGPFASDHLQYMIGEYMIYVQFYCVTWKGVVILILYYVKRQVYIPKKIGKGKSSEYKCQEIGIDILSVNRDV